MSNWTAIRVNMSGFYTVAENEPAAALQTGGVYGGAHWKIIASQSCNLYRLPLIFTSKHSPPAIFLWCYLRSSSRFGKATEHFRE
jgi:hypothetical protein